MENSVDLELMEHSVVSDVGLHCLQGLSVPILKVITVHSMVFRKLAIIRS